MDYYTLSQVWLNTTTEIDEINEKNGFRKDICSARICWSHYGNRNSQFGWEVDHIIPLSKGGTNHISNLRVLQWKNNATKSNGNLRIKVVSSGIKNLETNL